MNEDLKTLKQFIDQCSEEGRHTLLEYLRGKMPRHPLEVKWDIDAETILTAIYRSPDLTQRGVRGILAEAVFERDVLPSVGKLGWHNLEMPPGDPPYDFILEKQARKVRVQVKLQRTEKGQPKLFKNRQSVPELYVVEVQKTRSGVKKNKGKTKESVRSKESTRPYRFGDFDILAVNMQPKTGKWDDFRYTVAKWLVPRESNSELIKIFQPVSLVPDDLWTDKLDVCLEWLQLRQARKVRSLVPR